MWWREEKPESVGPPPADVKERLSLLSIFARGSAEDIERLASAAEEARFSAGRQVIREGRIPSHLYIVLTGQLEVWTTGDRGEAERLVNTLGPGDHFGEVGLIEGMPSTATVKTVEPCTLLRLSAPVFLEVAAGSPGVNAAIIRSVGGAMARSHPSYQPAVETAPVVLSPKLVIEQITSLLPTLEPSEREGLIAELKQLVARQGDGV